MCTKGTNSLTIFLEESIVVLSNFGTIQEYPDQPNWRQDLTSTYCKWRRTTWLKTYMVLYTIKLCVFVETTQHNLCTCIKWYLACLPSPTHLKNKWVFDIFIWVCIILIWLSPLLTLTQMTRHFIFWSTNTDWIWKLMYNVWIVPCSWVTRTG